MSIQHFYLILLALFSPTFSAFSIPPSNPPSILNSRSPLLLPSNPLNLTNGFGVCLPPTTLSSLRPVFSDCEKAIRERLPYHPGKATFHTGGAVDAFRLPGYAKYGTCNVTVVLGGGAATEVSSWLDIAAAATEMNEICRVGELTGGKTTAGLRGNIWIKLGVVDFRGSLVETS